MNDEIIPKPKALKAIIFDMDGVIIDSDEIISKGIQEFSRELGLEEINHDFVMKHLGGNSYRFWKIIKKKYNLSYDVEFLVEKARNKYIDFFKHDPSIKPIDGIPGLIDSISKNGIPIVLATSGSERRMNIVLNRLGLFDKFVFLLSSKDVKKGKPYPEIFLLAANKLGVDPESCLVIEDSNNGVTSAIAAGMKCIGYKNDNSSQDLNQAHHIINSFTNIDFEYLKSKWKTLYD
jgi:HAD superfamily hydrolase (TIGR01509 family)